jgi:fumarylacetoacetate (FAA) hydrolase family protein
VIIPSRTGLNLAKESDMDLSGYRDRILPADAAAAVLVGRLYDPDVKGPCVVAVRGDELVDVSGAAPTMADLLDRADRLEIARHYGVRSWPTAEVLAATLSGAPDVPQLLAPVDLQVIKAAGVTFVRSMLERVIEERAGGDRDKADAIREELASLIGGALTQVRPGSPEAERVKQALLSAGAWSQYLEVGIGPDPEIFTKAPVLSAVGTGAEIGVLERSTWNNPEPELVLAVTSAGQIVGATLGNDVNLRDFEGRSALLLAEAKDNNASCAIGPFIRLFDGDFRLENATAETIALQITGADGYFLEGASEVSEISRPPHDLVRAAYGEHHQYPDGFVLFTGTMFAPTDDRLGPGLGFTHREFDVVALSAPSLGCLVNVVRTAETAPDWTFGIRDLMRNLAGRGLLGPV